MYNTLCVFDFDETLFKSPEKPENFKGNWMISKESLDEPYVPKIPPDSFWNIRLVNKALSCISNKDKYCILLTGRIDKFFEDRIRELLQQKKLNFKEIHLNEFGGDTLEFKIEKIYNVLRKHPEIKNINFWDDKKEYLKELTSEFSDKYKVSTNHVVTLKIKLK